MGLTNGATPVLLGCVSGSGRARWKGFPIGEVSWSVLPRPNLVAAVHGHFQPQVALEYPALDDTRMKPHPTRAPNGKSQSIGASVRHSCSAAPRSGQRPERTFRGHSQGQLYGRSFFASRLNAKQGER